MELSPVEVRVLGCLIEKRATTPEHYPLSTNALVNACNQKTNRDPVTSYTEREVVAAMMELRAQKLCRSISSGRTDKHKHILDETFHFDEHQLAALAIMLLRGPQTPGEIRTRTERYVGFSSVEAVEQVLRDLAQLEEPLVVDLGRGPGQSQDRYMHLFGGPIDADVLSNARSVSTASATLSRTDRLAELEATVASLVGRISRLESELGVIPPASSSSSETESQPSAETPMQPEMQPNEDGIAPS